MVDKKKNSAMVDFLKSVNMKSAGQKPEHMNEMACKPSKKETVHYPTLYLNSKNAPDLTGYDTGDDVVIIIKGKVTGHSINNYNGNSRETFDIQIRQIACTETNGESGNDKD